MASYKDVPPPALTLKSRVSCAAFRPNSGARLAFVSGSNTSKVSIPFSSLSEALLTTILRSARSPSLRNRGT